MKDTRYNELKVKNNQTIQNLSDSYQKVALIYTKKARGYAVKNCDTEIKIEQVLDTLASFDERRVAFSIAIPNESSFIEERIAELSKAVKDPDRVKSIVIVSLLVLAILAWFVISIWMRQETPLQRPTNLKYEIIEENKIKITWDEVEFATEGYFVGMIDENGIRKGDYEVSECSYVFTVDLTKRYTFYVNARKTDLLAESKTSEITYPSNQETSN